MDGLIMKYFVLKPKGIDVYAEASRKAMRAYANHIEMANKELSKHLRDWAHSESVFAINKKFEDQPKSENEGSHE